MKKYIAICFSGLILMACTQKSEVSEKASENPKLLSSDTVQSKSVEKEELISLDQTQWKDIKASAYKTTEELTSIDFNVGDLVGAKVWLTTEQQIVIDFIDENGLFTGAKILPLPTEILNEFNTSVKSEMKNVIGDESSAKELILTWSTGDGNSGFASGYEIEVAGVFIIDLVENKLVQDFIYEDHFLSYQADPSEEDMNNPEYHGKMDEDAELEICSYASKFELGLNTLKIEKTFFDQEGKETCDAKDISGEYTFDAQKRAYYK